MAERILSISAVCPPLPRTIRRCVGVIEGSGRWLGRGRERIEARRKNDRLMRSRVAADVIRRVVWKKDRLVIEERPS